MTTSIHVCRGNFRSTFVSSGGYEPIADLLFNKTNVDAYFLEWDSDRAGDLSPLRFLPKGKKVVLGLITTKTGTLETKDAIRRRIDEATKYVEPRPAVPVARSAASPRPRKATRWPRTSSGPS